MRTLSAGSTAVRHHVARWIHRPTQSLTSYSTHRTVPIVQCAARAERQSRPGPPHQYAARTPPPPAPKESVLRPQAYTPAATETPPATRGRKLQPDKWSGACPSSFKRCVVEKRPRGHLLWLRHNRSLPLPLPPATRASCHTPRHARRGLVRAARNGRTPHGQPNQGAGCLPPSSPSAVTPPPPPSPPQRRGAPSQQTARPARRPLPWRRGGNNKTDPQRAPRRRRHAGPALARAPSGGRDGHAAPRPRRRQSRPTGA